MARLPSTLVSRRENISACDTASASTKSSNISYGALDLILPEALLRHDAGYAPSVTGNHDGFPALDRIKQPGEVGLRFRGLHFAHIDWLHWPVID